MWSARKNNHAPWRRVLAKAWRCFRQIANPRFSASSLRILRSAEKTTTRVYSGKTTNAHPTILSKSNSNTLLLVLQLDQFLNLRKSTIMFTFNTPLRDENDQSVCPLKLGQGWSARRVRRVVVACCLASCCGCGLKSCGHGNLFGCIDVWYSLNNLCGYFYSPPPANVTWCLASVNVTCMAGNSWRWWRQIRMEEGDSKLGGYSPTPLLPDAHFP